MGYGNGKDVRMEGGSEQEELWPQGKLHDSHFKETLIDSWFRPVTTLSVTHTDDVRLA